MMIKMKKVILLFAMTMKSYGFSIGSLYTLLQNFRFFFLFIVRFISDFIIFKAKYSDFIFCFFRDQYNEILMREYCAQFERDLENDNYTPITVGNDEEFKSIIKQFPFYKRGLDQVKNLIVKEIIFDINYLVILLQKLLLQRKASSGSLSSYISFFQICSNSIRSIKKLFNWMSQIHGTFATITN